MRWYLVCLLTLALTACGSAAAPQAPPAADAVVAQLKASGIPIGQTVALTAETDPNKLLGRPGQYTSKATFADTRLPATAAPSLDAGGSVETFASQADAVARFDYLKRVTAGNGALAEYDYMHGQALLRLSHMLTPDQAIAYEQQFVRVT